MARMAVLGGALLAAASTSAYFDYKTDCSANCQRHNLPCIITELSPVHFPCDCVDTDGDCAEHASPTVVCLMPDAPPIGGNESWIPYWNYTHPKPPGPPPNPQPIQDTNFLQIYAAVVTTILVIKLGSSMLQCVAQVWRRRRYERLETTQAPSSGVPLSPESPYPSTVQNV